MFCPRVWGKKSEMQRWVLKRYKRDRKWSHPTNLQILGDFRQIWAGLSLGCGKKLKRIPVPRIYLHLLVYPNSTLMTLSLWLQVNQFIKVKVLLGGKNLNSEDRGTMFPYMLYQPSPPRSSSLIRPVCQSWSAWGMALSLSELPLPHS